MRATYKVWVHVEKVDEDEDVYEDQGLPVLAAEFDTEAEATAFAEALEG